MDAINSLGDYQFKRNLDRAWLNQQSIANNIANVNTPNFRGEHIDINDSSMQLELPITISQTGHLPLATEVGATDIKKIPVTDLNLDSEMAEMSKNNLFYQTLVETIMKRDHMAKSVLEGR